MSIHRQRLGLYIPWALFALACLGWTAFWFVAKDQAIRRLDAAIVSAKARGIDAGYGAVRASGFPLHLTLTLTGAHLQASPLPRFEAKKLPVSVNLVDPFHLIVDLKDGVRWTGRDGASHEIDPTRGAMSVHWKGRTMTRVSIDLEGAPAPRMLVHIRPDARTPDAWQVAVDISGHETDLAERVRIGVVLDHTSALAQTRAGDPLGPWVDAGGHANVEALDLDWHGSKVTGAGALRLDALRRPEGAIELQITGGADGLMALFGGQSLKSSGAATLRAQDGTWRLGDISAPARPLYPLSSPPASAD
ncbi:MAG: DUF2125 domain-containing protein [Hyphomonadaceae bacterium]|nr:MAG: hypothetical protein FD160_2811 [Caulobacteraceae bacterium]MBT9447800.1 DUF2125 domain-containing protein [Hyphomonadaceae bacterium]TPW02348.1 MAG: hypothetical protein FD124_3430 [Alphaproteobacteria bacterium]